MKLPPAMRDITHHLVQANPRAAGHYQGALINKIKLIDRNGEQMTKQKLDALLERMNQGKDIEQGMDLLLQVYHYL